LSGESSLLTGLLFDETGDRLTPSHATKQGRRYRYYVSRRLIEENSDDPTGWRLPAHEIEHVVISALVALLTNPRELMPMIGDQNKMGRETEPDGIESETSQVWRKVLTSLWREGISLSKLADQLAIPERELSTLLFWDRCGAGSANSWTNTAPS